MLIFIAGIHGVGKGGFCRALESLTKFKHFSASELIKWEKISTRENKLVQDISSTQDLLLAALEQKQENYSKIILDGHFILLNGNATPTPIDPAVFHAIAPGLIVCLTHDPAVIHERLQNRDGKDYTVDLLTEMQHMELEHSKRCANSLGVQYLVIDSAEAVEKIIPLIPLS